MKRHHLLLAEKFINVDFLVPFPKFEHNLRAEIGAYIEKPGKLWASPSWQCHLDYSTNFQKNDSTIDVGWLLHQVEKEVNLAEQEFDVPRNYTSSFLNNEATEVQDIHRPPSNDGSCVGWIISTRNRAWSRILQI